MSLNFTQMLQDSGNFFRNQQKTMWQFVGLIVVLQGLFMLLPMPTMAIAENGLPDMSQVNSESLVWYLAIKGAMLFINTWGLATIYKISRENDRTLANSLALALRKIAGVLLLNMLMILPMGIGIGQISVALFSQTAPSLSATLMLFFGIWIFVRLNLMDVHYLTTQDNLGQTIKTVWLQGRNTKGPLWIYTLLAYFIAPLALSVLQQLPENVVLDFVSIIIIALMSLFILVFTYRFYSLWIVENK